ncbi:hypothetical protein ACFY0G_40375 [Streptomyces sp. NPDC001552]|uniref:hypothetical protein n=1 Tax=Streptomyces sp. NPDC001552 TaxID=3364587 RepID=UPI00368983EF
MSDRSPQEWREILANAKYPEEVRKGGSRRLRRRAKVRHREDVRNQTQEWVREQRRRDPIRPAGALIVVVLILAMGAGARWVWPDLFGEQGKSAPSGTAAAPATPGDNKPADPAVPSSPSSSPSASISPTPSVDLSKPNHVAEQAVRLYLTRNPPEDKTHRAVIERAEPYLAPALAVNLAEHSDPAWDKLVSRGGVSTVRTVTVTPSGKDLPGDSPLRVWRKATATVDVEGYTNYSETTVLDLEVMTSSDGKWRVTRILGL